VVAGLEAATGRGFRSDARQAVVVIGDAAPHLEDRNSVEKLVAEFVNAAPDRFLSTAFVETRAFQVAGDRDDVWFADTAKRGRGVAIRHRGSLTESILLAVLRP